MFHVLLCSALLADQGPCPTGYSHVFDGYLSCALDPLQPCAKKVIVGSSVKPVLMSECMAACGGCIGLSLWGSTECWTYGAWFDDGGGTRRHDEQSVICHRNEPPPPRPPPRPPPPPGLPPPPPPMPTHDIALSEVSAAKEHLKTAGAALLSGVNPLILAAAAVGLAIVAILLLVASCLCMRQCSPTAPRYRYDDDDYDDEDFEDVLDDAFDDDDDSFDDDDDERLGSGRRGRGGGGARIGPSANSAAPPQRVLVEVDGAVVGTLRVRTTGCRSVPSLRRKVCAACRELTSGVREEAMVLEYLDEGAGLAVLVAEEAELPTALRMATLKATFSRSGAGRGRRASREGGGARRSRGKPARKKGIERGLRSEEDADLDDDEGDSDEDYTPRRDGGCVLQ